MRCLKLTYHNKGILEATSDAFYIKSCQLQEALKQMKHWKLHNLQVSLFPVPKSISDNSFNGLLVVLERPITIPSNLLVFALKKRSNRLYIPHDSEVFPVLKENELEDMLLYPIQVLLPVVGMVGFDVSDKIDIGKVIKPTQIKEEPWLSPEKGNSTIHKIKSLGLKPISEEDLLKGITETIDKKPLSDILKTEKKQKKSDKGKLKKATNSIKRSIFKGGVRLINKFEGDPNSHSGGHIHYTEGPSHYAEGPSLLDRLENWLVRQLNDLEKERDSELNRLMDLFKTNSDEALKYAIPLNSPYLNRGEARPGSKLHRRSSNRFSLRSLGREGAADVWDIDGYYDRLRRQYEESAQKAIEQKDYKKACYVYANLLGDYHAAANILREGKHYHDAAVLYKDHLKNPATAAKCYEEGKLYHDAIKIYLELKDYESVANVYAKIGENKNANKYYDKVVTNLIENKAFVQAASILRDKQNKKEKSQDLLLEGWINKHNSSDCLKAFFDHVEDGELQGKEVKRIYSSHVTIRNELKFLEVIRKTKSKHPVFKANTEEITYEIVSRQAVKGNVGILRKLTAMLPDDQILRSDISRFRHQNKPNNYVRNKSFKSKLSNSSDWKKLYLSGNDVFVLGDRKNNLHLARADSYGNVNYTAWHEEAERLTDIKVVSDDQPYSKILLYSFNLPSLERRLFESNKYFPEKREIKQGTWMSKYTIGACISEKGNIATLELQSGAMILKTYDWDGSLLSNNACLFDVDSRQKIIQFSSSFEVLFMDFSSGYYHCVFQNCYARVDENGDVQLQTFDSMALSVYSTYRLVDSAITVICENGTLISFSRNAPINESLKHELDNHPYSKYMFGAMISKDHLILGDEEGIISLNLETKQIESERSLCSDHEKIIDIAVGPKHNQIVVLKSNEVLDFIEISPV